MGRRWFHETDPMIYKGFRRQLLIHFRRHPYWRHHEVDDCWKKRCEMKWAVGTVEIRW